MLSELLLENFILVQQAVFSFGPGLNVITGPTGAGKSLFVKALKLLLGERADASVIRAGSEQAIIQGIFFISKDLQKTLDHLGVEAESELIIRRIIHAKGKSRIFVNGALFTLQQLRTITSDLVSIASQHEYQNLLKRQKQLEMLDTFGGLQEERSSLASFYEETVELRRKAERLRERYKTREDEIERIRRQIQLIDEIDPKEGEEEELKDQLSLLRSSSRLRQLGDEIYSRLYGARGSITEELSLCRTDMEKMTEIDPSLQSHRELLDSLSFQAEDLAISLRDYLHGLPVDTTRLDTMEERLFRLQRLKKRFGPEISDVLQHRQVLERELDTYLQIEQEMLDLAEKLQHAETRLEQLAQGLSTKRHEASKAMEQAVKKELSELDLGKAAFEIHIHTPSPIVAKSVGPTGADKVEFTFSANPGQPLRSLAKVASGGELSRILLALKIVTGERRLEETMLFDEIDAGLGGEIAENVGKKLRQMGENYQVIAITHFPQIAAMGQLHLVVEKHDREGTTVTQVRELSATDRLDEIVRMLGGETDTARKYANELLSTVFRRS